MRRSPLVLAVVAAATVAALVLVIVVVLRASAPTSTESDERPASVAGQPVPAVTELPLVRIAAAGDTGTGDAAQLATAQRMIAEGEADPYDALLILGDLVYDEGDAALVDRVVLEPFAPLLDAGAELVPVLGNHDIESGEGDEILAALGRRRPWYVERVDTVRVIALDSNQVDNQAQTEWLEAVLDEPQPPGTWTVVAMHHPAYSAGQHGSEMAVRDAWGPLFAEAGVTLVLAGHDHDYQRSTPQDGVTYVVSGAGAKLRPTGQESFTAVSSSTLHYLDLLVYDDRIVGRAIDHSAHLVDLFTIAR